MKEEVYTIIVDEEIKQMKINYYTSFCDIKFENLEKNGCFLFNNRNSQVEIESRKLLTS